MRDYPNGGFFFIDAAPIQAAGEDGLKIDGIFEDAKRAIEGGKVFVMTNFALEEDALLSGTMAAMGGAEGVQAMLSVTPNVVALIITPEDIVTITST